MGMIPSRVLWAILRSLVDSADPLPGDHGQDFIRASVVALLGGGLPIPLVLVIDLERRALVTLWVVAGVEFGDGRIQWGL